MSDGMYEVFSGTGKNKKRVYPREIKINKYVDVVEFKDAIIISNKKEGSYVTLKRKTYARIKKEIK